MQTVFARQGGTGPSILLLHGFCETQEIWNPIFDKFTNHFHVLAPDLPGFGNSTLPAAGFSIREIADMLADWLVSEEAGKVSVMGHSLGGYIALSLAQHHADQLTGIGLINSTIFADTAEKKANRSKVIEFVRNHGVMPFVETFVPGLFADQRNSHIPFVHNIAAGTRAETLIAYSEAMRERPDQSETWKSSPLPKLLVAGAKDAIVPVADSRKMASMATRITYCELDNAAHMGFMEATDDCLTGISGFLRSALPNHHFNLG